MTGAHDKLKARCSAVDKLLLAALSGDRIPHDDDIDWQSVFEIAVRHQVAPLVFQKLGLNADVMAQIPQDIVARFHHETMRNMASKQAMDKALTEVVAWLGKRNVPVMLIKGTSLDQRAFSEPWLTVSGDVDLMLGRQLSELDPEVRSQIWQWNQARPVIDVHCTPHPDLVMNGILPVDFEGIWQRATPVEIGEHRAWMMDHTDELLSACINSCRKRYYRLKSLSEITLLVTQNDIDWDEVAKRAIDWDCHWIVYTALFATHAALDCPVPVNLRRRLRVPPMRAAALRWLALRRSFCTFKTLYDRLEIRSKNVGRSLLLCYASHTSRQLWRSMRILRGQLATANPPSRPHRQARC